MSSILDQAIDPEKDPQPRHPKILLWGTEGVGKTVTALKLASHFHRKLFGIDADGGLGAYKDDPDWREVFRYLYAENPVTVIEALDAILADPRDYGMVLLDPISIIWKETQHQVEEQRRAKQAAHGNVISLFENALHKGSWGPIKRWNFHLMQRIRRLQMPIIATAREANLWAKDDIVGRKPDCEETVPHEFDIVIRMSHTAGGRQAVVSKDRWHSLPQVMQAEIGDPFYVARELVQRYGSKFEEEVRPNAFVEDHQVQRLYELQALLNLDPVATLKRVRELYGAEGFEELRPDQAGELIATLEGRLTPETTESEAQQ